jgi:FkbM family methyltransferase
MSTTTPNSGLPEETRISRIAILRGHSFFPHLLNRDSVVVDLGGNRGEFIREIRSRFGCRCLVLEPNPDLFDAMEAGGVEKFQLAVTSHDGRVILNLAANCECSSLGQLPEGDLTRRVEVQGVRLAGFLKAQRVARVDLLKVDIEGAEIAMFDSLDDAWLSNASQIAVEFHDFNRMVTFEDVQRMRRRLTKLRFAELRMSRGGFLNVLYVNRALCRMSSAELAYTGYAVPRLASLMRGAARLRDRLVRSG